MCFYAEKRFGGSTARAIEALSGEMPPGEEAISMAGPCADASWGCVWIGSEDHVQIRSEDTSIVPNKKH